MENLEQEAPIRIFVFRPYIPIFLKKGDIVSYENLLSTISKQYGTQFQSLHRMNGKEITNSDQLKGDKVYIAVEKDVHHLLSNFSKQPSADNLQVENDTTSDESDAANVLNLKSQIDLGRKIWRKRISAEGSSKGDVFIYVHSLYTYINSLLPYGCTLKYRDMKSVEGVLRKLATILNAPGHFIMSLYDEDKTEITNSKQLKNNHHYFAMPHILTYEGYEFLKNLTPQNIKKYCADSCYTIKGQQNQIESSDNLSSGNSSISCNESNRGSIESDQELETKFPQNIKIVTVEVINTGVAMEEKATEKDSNPRNATCQCQEPHSEKCPTMKTQKNLTSDSSGNEANVCSYYTCETASEISSVHLGHINCNCPKEAVRTSNEPNSKDQKSLSSTFSNEYPKDISYYCQPCHESLSTHICQENCDCLKSKEQSGECSSIDDGSEHLTRSINKIIQMLKDSQEITLLKKSSPHTSLKITPDETCNCTCEHACPKGLAANLMEFLMRDIRLKKMVTPILDASLKKPGGSASDENLILEPLLLAFCELAIDVFQSISTSLNEKISIEPS